MERKAFRPRMNVNLLRKTAIGTTSVVSFFDAKERTMKFQVQRYPFGYPESVIKDGFSGFPEALAWMKRNFPGHGIVSEKVVKTLAPNVVVEVVTEVTDSKTNEKHKVTYWALRDGHVDGPDVRRFARLDEAIAFGEEQKNQTAADLPKSITKPRKRKAA